MREDARNDRDFSTHNGRGEQLVGSGGGWIPERAFEELEKSLLSALVPL